MRCVLALAIAFFINIAPTTSSQAGYSYSRSARSGRLTKIDTFMGWNNDCSFQTLKISVVKRPSHGRASPRVVYSRIARAKAGSAGRCLGKRIRGLAVYYRSRRGFHGRDDFSVRMKVRGKAPVLFHYNVSVR